LDTSIDAPEQIAVGWASAYMNYSSFVHSEGFAPLNQCPVARIPDLFALSTFEGFRLLGAVHGYGLFRQMQWQFLAEESVHEKGFIVSESVFI